MIPAAEAKEITIEADMNSGIPEFLGDPENLQQVLLNLLGNAIKFSPQGSRILVTIKEGGSVRGP